MDPHLRWLRRLVVARVLERLAIESITLGALIGAAMVWADGSPIEVGGAVAAAMVAWPTGRLGLALVTNPIGHRYLLRWTDPSAGFEAASGRGPATEEVARELDDAGFRFRIRLRGRPGSDQTGVGPMASEAGADDPSPPGLDLFEADGGRLVVSHSDDGEVTVLSRLDDGRLLVTSEGFVPPVRTLVVNRIVEGGSRPARRGGARSDEVVGPALLSHVDRLLQLRRLGVETVPTGPSTVVALSRVEWQAWQELGPFLGPLIAVEPHGGLLRLQARVPADVVLARTSGRRPDRPPRPDRTSKTSAGMDRSGNGGSAAPVAR